MKLYFQFNVYPLVGFTRDISGGGAGNLLCSFLARPRESAELDQFHGLEKFLECSQSIVGEAQK
ncbi:MAG: hypothetical protein O7D30_12105 [Rickettsia endosymbiont of Ixodes persulcatus]|nr:hypothetical protein [Rickettsia endosymbiont of Ixodes persulcatus]